MKKISLKDDNLVVDWISLNIAGLLDPDPIARYLLQFGFNSNLKQTSSEKFEVLFHNSQNQYQVVFVPQSQKFWTGFTVSFSGKNATYFYDLLKNQKIDLAIFDFSQTNFGRLDICYFRKTKAIDQDKYLQSFLEESKKKYLSLAHTKYAKLDYNSKGFILRLGNRKSSNYYRVYQKNLGLQFELELKKAALKPFQQFFFEGRIQEFEERLAKYFYQQSHKVLALDFSYADWLLIRLRQLKLFQLPGSQICLVTDYLKNNTLDSLDQKESFFRLLQFLSFIRTIPNTNSIAAGNQIYYIVQFPFNQFLEFIHIDTTSSYQRKKVLRVLRSLTKLKPLVYKFSEEQFRSSVTIPHVESFKKGNCSMVLMLITKELYTYKYPFFFPSSFISYQSKYDLQIKLQFVESISNIGIQKQFQLQTFIDQFSVSNKKHTQIKQIIIDLFHELKDQGFIQDEFQLVYQDNSIQKVTKLTLQSFINLKSIQFYELFYQSF